MQGGGSGSGTGTSPFGAGLQGGHFKPCQNRDLSSCQTNVLPKHLCWGTGGVPKTLQVLVLPPCMNHHPSQSRDTLGTAPLSPRGRVCVHPRRVLLQLSDSRDWGGNAQLKPNLEMFLD